MISRIWHGQTVPANADAYESLLKSEIFVGIQNRRIGGYRSSHSPPIIHTLHYFRPRYGYRSFWFRRP